ncbi:MAG: deoxyribodipyrimidine photolyase [Burkholderiales bacterium]|nr:MAG: deoxyribodipyrimidine photolyase [Burkholderiales bacterium]
MAEDFPYHGVAARLAAVDPDAYARSRNAIGGRVTRLSPYLTHGMLTVPAVIRAVAATHPLSIADKLVFELGWREYYQHVWSRLGDAILDDIGAPVWSGRYAQVLPDDVLSASSGVAAIDAAVRELYQRGYVHNHARMWLASYLVHVRKVHWRAAADWMYGHLLDGDLASNHLSLQWVAGTFSAKPYLFNADNVARHAPAAWSCSGTVLDRSYAELDAIARSGVDPGPEPGRRPAPVAAPELYGEPPPALQAEPPGWCLDPQDAARIAGATARLRHPWDLADPKPGEGPSLGLVHLPFHRRFRWSAARWRWVMCRMHALCDAVYVGDLGQLVEARAGGPARVPKPSASDAPCIETLNPGYAALLPRLCGQRPIPRQFPNPDTLCRSFSRFWAQVRRETRSLVADA